MEIIEKDINSLIPYEFNNKIHDETQVNRIANSIREFWFTQPLVIDKNNIVVIWHWRLEGAKKLWLEKVPCLVMEELTETQIKKLRILDNKLNESDYNLANLKLELDSLDDLNFGELEYSTEDIFPELKTEEFNPEDYEEGEGEQKERDGYSLVVYAQDEGELELLKKDLDELGYKYK